MDPKELEEFQDKIENSLYSTLENFALFQAERMIDEKGKEIKKEMQNMKDQIENDLIMEIYQAKKEILERIRNLSPESKKSFWKWWK